MIYRPDPGERWAPPPATTPDNGGDPTWLDHATNLTNNIPGWIWAATAATLMAAALITLPITRKAAYRAGQRAAGNGPTSNQHRDRALLVAALIPAVLFWLAVLIGSARGLVAFGRDDLRWRDGWELLVPGTLDGVGISFGFLAFLAVRNRRSPDRAVRLASGAMMAGATINFLHEAGLPNGSWLGGGYLALMSVFGLLIFHELLDQFEQGADTIVRKRPKFGIRWITYTPNTVCAALAWINHPPAEGTPATVAAAVEHLEHVRQAKRARRAEQFDTAAPWWTPILPWLRVAQLDAALTERSTAAAADRAQMTELAERLEKVEAQYTDAATRAEQYAERLARIDSADSAPNPMRSTPTRATPATESTPESRQLPAATNTADSTPTRPTPTPRVAPTQRANTAPTPTPARGEPARIGGDEAEMVDAIREFVAEFKATRGKVPGQQVTRTELARLGFRVGTKRAGELADLADSMNESESKQRVDSTDSAPDSPTASAGDSATDSPLTEQADSDSDSADLQERSA